MRIQLDSVALEADVILSSNKDKGKLAVCLHPWSWLGGQMLDPVLEDLVAPLRSKDFHIIRYNSRGVGGSSGWPSFTGFKECEDLQALVQWALANPEMPNINIVVIIGYSYGSLITGTHPILPLPIKTSHILISYPVSVRGWLTLFRTSTYTQKLKDLVSNPDSHVLALYGDRDEFTSRASYSDWEKDLKSAAGSERGQLDIECIEGASHFWRGRSGQHLQETIERWLP